MGAGANAGSFGAGFGKGLANALVSNRDRADQKKRDEQARRDRLFQSMLPVLIDNVEDVADLEPFFAQHLPEQFGGKPGKKGGSPFDNIKRFLGPLIGMRGQPRDPRDIGDPSGTRIGVGFGGGNIYMGRGTPDIPSSSQPPGVTGGTLDSLLTPQPRATMESRIGDPSAGQPLPQPINAATGGTALDDAMQGRNIPELQIGGAQAPAGQPAAPRRTLLGVPILSADEKLTRDIDRRKILIDRARTSILPALKAVDPTATIEDALSLIATGRMATDRAAANAPQAGSNAALIQAENDARATAGQPPMNVDETRAFIVNIEREQAAATRGYGVDREAIAGELFNRPFDALQQSQKAEVIKREQEYLEAEARRRALGTGQGRFEAPLTLDQAQSTGAQVGTSSADYAGQTVAPLDIAERRRSLDVLRTEVSNLLTPATKDETTGVITPGLLDVLPSSNDLGGRAPGAAYALKKRFDPRARVAAARLEAVVDGMVNTLARLKNEQRGAQTEQDAIRAYNTVVALQTGLFDPFGGDTRESATARIQETLASIDRVMAGLPTSPVPNAQRPNQPAGQGNQPRPNQAAPAGRSGGQSGIQMNEKGEIFQNGVKTHNADGTPVRAR